MIFVERVPIERLTTEAIGVDLRDLKTQDLYLRLPRGGYAQRLAEHITIDWHGMRLTVPLAETTPQFGGRRYWFHCRQCGRRARIVYSPDFYCRICSGFCIHRRGRRRETGRSIKPFDSDATLGEAGTCWSRSRPSPRRCDRHYGEAIFKVPEIRAEEPLERASSDCRTVGSAYTRTESEEEETTGRDPNKERSEALTRHAVCWAGEFTGAFSEAAKRKCANSSIT